MQIDQDIEHLAALIAAKTGQTPAIVVREAVEERARMAGIELSPRPLQKTLDEAAIRALIERTAALPILDDRTPDEILGYDEFGVPR
jgi:antitoxin VapB